MPNGGYALPALRFLATVLDAEPWRDFRFLVGEWDARGGGEPGVGQGGFRFALELGEKVLIRTSRVDYATTPERSPFTHEDLVIIYREAERVRAMYFDSEGHVIRYAVEVSADGCVWVSEPAPGPRFRLTYRRLSADELSVGFDIATSDAPDRFVTHVEGIARRRR